MPHHLQLVGKWVLCNQLAAKQFIMGNSVLFTVCKHSFFHRVVGIGFTAHAHDGYKRLFVAIRCPRILHGHLVHRDRTGFVYAQNRNRTERFHARKFTNK